MKVVKLLSSGKESFVSVSSHPFSKTETEPSEKYISRSQEVAFMVSFSL